MTTRCHDPRHAKGAPEHSEDSVSAAPAESGEAALASTDLPSPGPPSPNRPSPNPPSRRLVLQGAAGLLALTGVAGCGDGSESTPATETADAAFDGSFGELPDELWRASARQLAAAIRTGEVTSLEVVEAHLTRIDAVNPAVNAVVAVYAEEARAGARAADEAVAAGEPLGPLHGVPFTIKDNIDQRGKPNTSGLEEGLEAIAQHDAPCVERMLSAGAVPIGRTNLPDMGLRVHTQSELWGRTLNPWSAEHNVGGSSGGEGAALAAGMSPIGLGNDIGGSVRNPANCCAIASLKPSLGRIPGTGGTIGSQLMAVEGPMARTVADVRLGYEILAGVHPADPWTVPVPLDLPAPDARRVALVPEPSGGATDPTVAEAVRVAGRALEAAGWEVVEAEPPNLEAVVAAWTDLLGNELLGGRDFLAQVMSEESYRFLGYFFEDFGNVGLGPYSDSTARRHALLVEWNEFLERYPLIVGPVFTQPPFEVGYDIAGADEAADVLNQLRLVVAVNLLGLPAAAVPTGIADDGLPRGVQVIAGRFYDGLALEGASAIEAALGTFTPIDPRS